jgi:hypothetical protein
MISRCLSADGFRFLVHPFPLRCSVVLAIDLLHYPCRPHWGFHVPHAGEAVGVGALYTAGKWCPLKTLEREF